MGPPRALFYMYIETPLSNVLDHQVAADVKEDFLSNFLYILIIFKWHLHKDDLNKLGFRW